MIFYVNGCPVHVMPLSSYGTVDPRRSPTARYNKRYPLALDPERGFGRCKPQPVQVRIPHWMKCGRLSTAPL
jgi:hypothetical protein